MKPFFNVIFIIASIVRVFLVFRRISVFQFKSESFFSLKPSAPQGEIIPQNFSSLGFAVSEELGNKHTDKQTDSLTLYCFYGVIDKNYEKIDKIALK